MTIFSMSFGAGRITVETELVREETEMIESKGIIRDYRSIMDHITRTVASVNGVVTKAENDQRDKLEAQLMNRGLSHVMTDEDVEDYYDALPHE